MRDPNRVDPILARLRAAWIARPDLRLGQLLVGSLPMPAFYASPSDDAWMADRMRRLFNAECAEFGAANAPIVWPDSPTPTPAPGLDLDAVEATISDDQLSAWMEVAGAASPAALQYGPSRGDGRAFILDAYNKGPSGPVHAVWFGDPDDALIVAVTGNGPTSEANAKHIAWSSPRNVAALIAEVRALRHHCDAAGPDHNLLALLDLYHEREQAALAKLAEAKRLGLIAARVVLDDDTDLPAIAAALEAL